MKENDFEQKQSQFMTFSILQDQQMSAQFIVFDLESLDEKQQELKYRINIEDCTDEIEKKEDNQKEKQNVSRLDIEIKKNNFNLKAISGELFILLFNAQLESKTGMEKGKLMMTNYRLIFYSKAKKLVDLPFGMVGKLQFIEKYQKMAVKLKFPHCWNFCIRNKVKFNQLKSCLQIYLKPESLKSCFAFTYSLKIPFSPKYYFSLKMQYDRIGIQKFADLLMIYDNCKFEICQSYPPYFYSIIEENNTKNQISFKTSNHRKNNRFPILSYIYKNNQTKAKACIWTTSSYQDGKVDGKLEELWLKRMHWNKEMKMIVFVGQNKAKKALQQSNFYKQVDMVYFKIQTLSQLKIAEQRMVGTYLFSKRSFIKDVINSKWYNNVGNIIDSSQIIANKILQGHSIIIRCDTGFDRTNQLLALTQIILDPFYRTFKGFETLVMSQFVNLGHPFASRLGERYNMSQYSPVFLQFLDCVSQLIHQNPFSFQFNVKYLSRISMLMHTNIYGTFICNSPKEYYKGHVEEETVSIWRDLISSITQSAFYDNKFGILKGNGSLDRMRFWREHFGSLIAKNKDHYKLNILAQDNSDYINLECLRIRAENENIKAKIKQQMIELNRLKNIK